MSDRAPPPPSTFPPPPAPRGRGLGWFLAISGSLLLVFSLGCMLAITEGDLLSQDGELALFCASPTLALGGLFLWLGSRRLKR